MCSNSRLRAPVRTPTMCVHGWEKMWECKGVSGRVCTHDRTCQCEPVDYGNVPISRRSRLVIVISSSMPISSLLKSGSNLPKPRPSSNDARSVYTAHARTHTHTHTHTHIRTHIHTHIHTFVHTRTTIHAHHTNNVHTHKSSTTGPSENHLYRRSMQSRPK
jgi:hypothetical protein